MDLRQLQALVAVADHKTFSAAAQALTTVQSNVSAHIARLEREVGATLVDRAAGELTVEGVAVVERARRIEAELAAIRADVAALTSELVGRVRIGVIGTTARWLVPLLLPETHERHPKVAVEVVDATSTSLEPRLASGSIDLAVVNLPLPSPDLRAETLFDEDLVLFVPRGHALAGADEPVPLQRLEGTPLLIPPRGTAYRELLEIAASEAKVALRPEAELDGLRLIASLAISGQGSAILPATAIPAEFRERTVPKSLLGLPRRSVGLAQRRRGRLSAPARAVAEAVWDLVHANVPSPGLHVPSGATTPAGRRLRARQ